MDPVSLREDFIQEILMEFKDLSPEQKACILLLFN